MTDRLLSQFTKPFGPGLAARSIFPTNAPDAETGTALAKRNRRAGDRKSIPASSSPKARHTGAGRRATTISNALTRRQCEQILWASSRASLAGEPFNRHSTFHHEALGIPNEAGHAAISALIKLASDFLATKGHRLRWIFTRENGPSKGGHAHILWHVPQEAARAFFGRWPTWKAKLARRFAKPHVGRGGRVMMTRCIGGSALAYRSTPQNFAFHLAEMLGYALKGATPETIAALSLAKDHQYGSAIIGRRAGWWREHRPRAALLACAA